MQHKICYIQINKFWKKTKERSSEWLVNSDPGKPVVMVRHHMLTSST